MYYVKKPIPVKALQLVPRNEKYLLENKWVDEIVYSENSELHHALIKTLEGTMTSMRGDYIVEGIHGEHWSVKKGYF